MTRTSPLIFCLLSSTALANPGAEILKQVDHALSNFEDQIIDFRAENLKPGTQTPQTITFTTKVKGEKTFTEFLSPGDVKGMRVLTMNPTQIYIWLPEFSKMRRVASHSLNQGFMGTSLSQQDMATYAYSGLYTAEQTAEDDATWTLTLTTRDSKNTAYDKLSMVVDKKMKVPLKIDYYNDEGTEVVREMTRSNYQCNANNYCMFGYMKMVDKTTGGWTTLTPTRALVDQGIEDSLFSPRTLQLGQ